MQLFSILSVVLAAVFAAIAIGSALKCAARLQQLEGILSALSNERGRIAAHDAELDQITATLRKLSGRIGAMKRAENSEDSNSEIPAMIRPIGDAAAYKAQLRAKLGLVPGKPAPRG